MGGLILCGKMMRRSLLITFICLGGFYCGYKLVSIFTGGK